MHTFKEQLHFVHSVYTVPLVLLLYTRLVLMVESCGAPPVKKLSHANCTIKIPILNPRGYSVCQIFSVNRLHFVSFFFSLYPVRHGSVSLPNLLENVCEWSSVALEGNLKLESLFQEMTWTSSIEIEVSFKQL